MAMTNFVTLKDHAWTNSVLHSVHKMWKENVLCDTQIKCLNHETLNAHSLVLAGSSTFLKSFFSKARQGLYTLKMDTIPVQVWQYLLEFLYTGSLRLPASQVFPLYNMVKKLQIDQVESLCERYIQSTLTGNVSNIVTLNENGSTLTGAIATPLPSSTAATNQGSSDGIFVTPSAPPPLQRLSSSTESEQTIQIKQEIPEENEVDKTQQTVTGQSRTMARGRSSTASPESGVYSYSNSEQEHPPPSEDPHASDSVASPTDQDWNQLKLQNVRSLKETEDNSQDDNATADNFDNIEQDTNPNLSDSGFNTIDQPIDITSSPEAQSNSLSPFVQRFTPLSPNRAAEFKCIPCNRSFKSKNGLRLHTYSCSKKSRDQLRQYKKTGKLFKCKICSKFFKTYTRIWCHLKFHNGEGANVCNICEKNFPTASQLQHHMIVHMDGNTKLFDCATCKMAFATPDELKNHNQKKHTEKSMHVCTICGRKFNSLVIFRIHVDTHHEQELRTCKVCKQVFRSRKALNSHSRIHKSSHNVALFNTERSEPSNRFPNSESRVNKTNANISQEADERFTFQSDDNEVVERDNEGVITDDQNQAGAKVTSNNFTNGSYELISSTEVGTEKDPSHESYESGSYMGMQKIRLPTKPLPLGKLKKKRISKIPSSRCTICGKSFKKPGMLAIHLRVHQGLSRHQCKFCGRQFAHKGALTRHGSICNETSNAQVVVRQTNPSEETMSTSSESLEVSAIDKETALIAASAIDVSMNSSSKTIESMGEGGGTSTEQPVDMSVTTYSCSHCHMVFSDRRQLYRHICVDSNGNPIPKVYPCKVCNKEFLKSREYRDHVKTHRGNHAKRFECQECHKRFISKAARETHMYTHRKKQFECDQCQKMFRYEIVLAQHIYANHNGPPPYTCTLCPLRFVDRPSLEEHLNTHEGTKPFPCPHCDAEFTRDRQLRTHIFQAHDGIQPVEVDDSPENSPTPTVTSVSTEDNNSHSTPGPFLCEVCKKSFHSKRKLVTHMYKHATATPFNCQCCSKEFFYKQGFVEHFKRLKHLDCKKMYASMGQYPWQQSAQESESVSHESMEQIVPQEELQDEAVFHTSPVSEPELDTAYNGVSESPARETNTPVLPASVTEQIEDNPVETN